ncbi:MAG: helix-hairpin-helix domain-containing protein, partial [Actinobacteria bacterium]
AGITSTEQLARADVGRIAEIADVSTGRAQGWLDQIK